MTTTTTTPVTTTTTTTTTPPAVPVNVAGSSTPTASSQNTADGQTAAKAIDGVAAGYPGDYTKEWATVGGKATSWLQLTWASPVTLNKVVLYDRPNTNDRVTAGTLTFSDGTKVTVPTLTNNGAAVTVSFPARATTSLRFTVTTVSATTANVGLAELEAWSDGGTTTTTTPVTTTTTTPVTTTTTTPVTTTTTTPVTTTTTTPPPAVAANVAGSSTPTASSQNTADGQTAAKAIDGVAAGYPGDYTKEWATVGGKAGSWLQLTWASPVTLNKVVLYDRPNTSDRVTAGTLTFSDGTKVTVPTLTNNGAAVTVSFPARATTSLRFTVTTVSSTTANVGLAEIQAWTP